MTQLSRPGQTEPCDWPVSYAACTDTAEIFTDPADKTTFESLATTYLWEWTDRRYGPCPETIRPCRAYCDGGVGGAWRFFSGLRTSAGGWTPVMINGSWHNMFCGGCGSLDCSCDAVPHVNLPGPVASVTRVEIDGQTVPSDTYRLDGSMVIRESGRDWPDCQNLSLPLGQEGTWAIHYTRGLNVPQGGQIAAGVLAIELYKAACNDKSCQLPARVQSITRQGVTMAMLDQFEDSVDQGYTGIWIIDSWIASVTRPKPASVVQSPDYNFHGKRGMTHPW